MFRHRPLSGGSGGLRSGLVRPEGRMVRDDSGIFRPLGCSFFWAMQDFKGDRSHYGRNADWIASKGFDYARILCEVDWTGREIDPSSPAWADWKDILIGVIEDLYSRGVRTELTISGKGTKTDLRSLAMQVGDIVADGREHMVMNIEMQNEYTEGKGASLDMLSQMAVEVMNRVPNIAALSSPGDAAALKDKAYRLGMTGYTWHTDRGGDDHKWRQVRQPYDFKDYRPFVTSNNEPPGPGSSVVTNTSPLQLAMTRFVGIMCGGAMYVLHTGTGVLGDGQPHPDVGERPANFDEIDNIDAIVDAVRGIDELIPDGVENWTVANTQWKPPQPVAPFQAHHHWAGDAPVDDKGNDNTSGVNKAYSALGPDGRWVQAPIGVRKHVILTASYPLREVSVYDPLTRAVVPGFSGLSFTQGETMQLPGGGQDAMVAYIIHGRH